MSPGKRKRERDSFDLENISVSTTLDEQSLRGRQQNPQPKKNKMLAIGNATIASLTALRLKLQRKSLLSGFNANDEDMKKLKRMQYAISLLTNPDGEVTRRIVLDGAEDAEKRRSRFIYTTLISRDSERKRGAIPPAMFRGSGEGPTKARSSGATSNSEKSRLFKVIDRVLSEPITKREKLTAQKKRRQAIGNMRLPDSGSSPAIFSGERVRSNSIRLSEFPPSHSPAGLVTAEDQFIPMHLQQPLAATRSPQSAISQNRASSVINSSLLLQHLLEARAALDRAKSLTESAGFGFTNTVTSEVGASLNPNRLLRHQVWPTSGLLERSLSLAPDSMAVANPTISSLFREREAITERLRSAAAPAFARRINESTTNELAQNYGFPPLVESRITGGRPVVAADSSTVAASVAATRRAFEEWERRRMTSIPPILGPPPAAAEAAAKTPLNMAYLSLFQFPFNASPSLQAGIPQILIQGASNRVELPDARARQELLEDFFQPKPKISPHPAVLHAHPRLSAIPKRKKKTSESQTSGEEEEEGGSSSTKSLEE